MVGFMGLGLRILQRRFRAHLTAGERLLARDVGRLPDGGTAGLMMGERRLYVATGAAEVRQIGLTRIASLVHGGALDITLSDGERVAIGENRGTTGAVRAALRSSLLAMPMCHRRVEVAGVQAVVSYVPWRPGARASWGVVLSPGAPEGAEADLADLVEAVALDIGALVTAPDGAMPEGGLEVTPLPKAPSAPLFRVAWSHEFGVLPEDVLATRRSGQDNARVTCLVLDGDRVWVAESDSAEREHPRISSVPVEQVQVTPAAKSAPETAADPGGDAVVLAGHAGEAHVPLDAEGLPRWRSRLPPPGA
ncbi:hypothetical protein [Phaeacidiphilus oryzae]|uniref:hypothetical protein n=1 Tax=Phaeacidiphilus oryzae TaxID=348818 RepID=UPI00126A732A|nr:hypothetical protein [Phaeacidiphilus oryzae]